MEALLDQGEGARMLFDECRAHSADYAIQVTCVLSDAPLWIIGDLHGDLLALEAALELINQTDPGGPTPEARIIFLGDLFDDEGYGLEVLIRIFSIVVDAPGRVCVLAGNHDEALGYHEGRFTSTVEPGDFADFLNRNAAHEWIERAGKLAVRLFASAPRALFFPDGLLISHGGFPLSDLHPQLLSMGNWNDPMCLQDFVWTRAHPTARKKLPNRFSRGSQYGYEDLRAFALVAAALGRPVTHVVRGHDHVEERYAFYPKYADVPMLTTVALSRRLPRESIGSYHRVPTIARYRDHALPEVHRLHIPPAIIREVYPEPVGEGDAGQKTVECS
jgi:hypothetical protein